MIGSSTVSINVKGVVQERYRDFFSIGWRRFSGIPRLRISVYIGKNYEIYDG